MTTATSIPEDRPLTAREETLVGWLLKHGDPTAAAFIPQLSEARVVSRCYCGCGSIDFAINAVVPPVDVRIHILSDYQWQEADESRFGVFVFARGDQLAGLEVWSVDGQSAASSLPEIEQLRPLVITRIA